MPDLIAIESHVTELPALRRRARGPARGGRRAALRRGPRPRRRLDRSAVRRDQPHAGRGARSAGPPGPAGCSTTCTWCGLASRRRSRPLSAASLALSAVHFASPERDDSLAAMIEVISAPSGSDLNPVTNEQFLQVPTVPERGAIEVVLAQPVTHDELVRGAERRGDPGWTGVGRVGARAPKGATRARSARCSGHSRAPASSRAGWATAPVAVNLVWLLAHTTVKAKAPRTT